MKVLLVFVLAVVLVSPCQAQILDAEPDVIGFYLDPVGNVPGACVPLQAYTAYLMITRPSDTSGLTSYQCSFTIPPVVQTLGFQPAGGIIITDYFPVLDVFYPTPLPWANDVYILGTWNFFLGPGTGRVLLADHFQTGYFAAYRTVASGETRIPVWPADWANGMAPDPDIWAVVFWLNEPSWCRYIVDAETSSWGGVKGLYR